METPFGEIPEDWQVATTSDVFSVITDYVANGSFASLAENVNYKAEPDHAVLIRLTDYNNGFAGDFVHIDEHAYEFLGKSKLFGGEIIISNVGAYSGTVFRAPDLKKPMSLGPNAIMMNCDDGNDFYFYWLSSPAGKFSLDGIISGSAQPKFNKTSFRKLLVPVPPLPEQKAIAEVLSSLDDKIDLLHRQNATLEALAETLFRQTFIEEAQGDWEEEPLDQVANYLNGLACQKFPAKNPVERLPVLKIKDLKSGLSESSDWATSKVPPEYIVENGDIIFSWSASLLVKLWDGPKCVLNQHLFKVTSERFPGWFIYQWTKHHLDRFIAIAETKATTMGHIRRTDLAAAMVKVPDEQTLAAAEGVFGPIQRKVISNNRQIATLTEKRDALLPMLMSGEVRVKFEAANA